MMEHDDVIKWKHFPRNWPFVRGIHRSPVNSPHKGQWCRALMFTFICARINGWVNTRAAGDLRRYRPHYDVIVMKIVREMGPMSFLHAHVDGLVQDCSNSSVLAMVLLQSCTKPSIYWSLGTSDLTNNFYITCRNIIAGTFYLHFGPYDNMCS